MSGEGTVVLGFGPQGVEWLGKASKLCGKDAVMDPDVARMAGANLAAGKPEALAALRKRLEAGALQVEKMANPGLSEAATRWLANGERGVSSNTLFTALTGVDALGDWRADHPYDPADFRRCELLLTAVPGLRDQMYQMIKRSPQWAALVEQWGAIVAAMDEETPGWREGKSGRANKAYEIIKQAIGR